jgi:hypothetical protein
VSTVVPNPGLFPTCYVLIGAKGASNGVTDALCAVPGSSTLSVAEGGYTHLDDAAAAGSPVLEPSRTEMTEALRSIAFSGVDDSLGRIHAALRRVAAARDEGAQAAAN